MKLDKERLKQAKDWANSSLTSEEEYKEVYYFMYPIWCAYHEDTDNSAIFSIARTLLFRGGTAPLSHPIHRGILEIFSEDWNNKL